MSHNWECPWQGHPACELGVSSNCAWTYVLCSLQPSLEGRFLPLDIPGNWYVHTT